MKTILISVLITFTLGKAIAQREVLAKSHAAIQGYDPVAYFKLAMPVSGRPEFNYKWKNALWFFSSQQNLDDFKKNPEQYAPQFGGYCAYGMAAGHKVHASPDAWNVIDGKLYLNYNKSVQKLWNEDRRSNIEKAVKNWSNVNNEKDELFR